MGSGGDRVSAHRLLTAMVASLLILAGSASSAGGHASEVSTIPAAGATVTELPADVVIAFDSPIMEAGLAVVVRDPQGSIVSDSAPVVDRNEVRVQLRGAQDARGVFGVAYRVVSDDGHAMAGAFEFSVQGDVPGVIETKPVETAAAQSASAQTDDRQGDAPNALALIIVGLVVLVLVGAGLALRWRRGH